MPRFVPVTVGYAKFFIDERYTNLKPIGDGSYGLVASALDQVFMSHRVDSDSRIEIELLPFLYI
jgi:hypothetical protein